MTVEHQEDKERCREVDRMEYEQRNKQKRIAEAVQYRKSGAFANTHYHYRHIHNVPNVQ